MNKSSRLIINVLILILLLLNPLSSFAATAVEAQSIGSEKTLATVDITANIKWQGGPEQKPDLWLLLNREIDGSVKEVPGILPKQVSKATGPVTWYGLPKYASDGTEIDYSVSQGLWDAIRQKFTEIEPQGYQAFLSPDGLIITNIYIEREIILPVETDEPVLEPVVEETEPPASTPEPPEDLTEPVEQPEEPIELEDPIEAPVEPIEVPVELEDPIEPPALETPEPIELPIEVTKPPALETPEPVDPPVITPEPTVPSEETPLPKSITVSISWQGGETPRPAFWLKLQEIDLDGNKSDVAGTEPIKANFARQITWANVESYNVDSSYTVAIVDQTGAVASIPGYTSHIDGLSLTNIWQEQSANDVVAKVEWLFSMEPKEAIGWIEIVDFEIPTVWLRLYRQSGAHEVPVALLSTELKELADGATTAVWADMPKTNSMGVEYIYSVKQVDANGADFSHELFNKVENGLVVKNVAKDGNGLKGIFDPVATHTYTFKVDGVTVDTQIVKNGELLTEPAVPVKEGQKFTGWYVNGVKIDFTQPVTVSGTATVEAIAQFAPVLYVFFMDGVGDNARVIVTKEGIAGGTVSTTDVKPNLGSTQGVTGWYRDEALTDGPVGDTFTIGTTNQVLWPKIETGAYLYFESGDNATYIEPQFVPAGQNTVAPTDPTRPGYTFGHWSATPGGAMYGFGQPITSSVTLHAVWQATSTSYTVVYWKQSVNDNKTATDANKTYDFAQSATRTAFTGTSVSPTTGDGTMPFANFHYNAGKSVAVTVKIDGTTVLNVYYDRNLLTIDFRRTNGNLIESFTGLYGQTLAQNGYTWPSDYRWTRTTGGAGILTFLDAFIFDNLLDYGSATHITLYRQNNSGSSTITHYKETLAGGWVTANTNTTGGGSFGFTNKYTGFTVSEYSADGGEWLPAVIDQSASYSSTLDIRHTRNTYILSFYNYNGYAKTEQFKYEAPLAGQASYVPPRPSGLPAVYEFQGWYKDTAMTEPFNFATETMPANNLAIYAKWAPPVLSGTAHENLEGSGATYTIPVVYNQPIDRSTVPTVVDSVGNVLFQGDDSKTITMPANHKWIGWSTRDGSDYTTFNFNTRILSDITLYPYWVNNEKFNVTYVANGGGGTVPTDGQNYAYGSYADVAALGTLTPPAGMVFLGWENGGTLYQPGDKIRMTGNMELTAVWGPQSPTTMIIYKSNYPTDSQADDIIVGPLPNNSTHQLKDADTFAPPPGGYRFLHWRYTTKQGVVKYGQPGHEVMVDLTPNQDNIVEAIWMKLIDVTATKVWVNGPTPRPTVHFQLYRQIGTGAAAPVPGAEIKELPDGTTKVTWINLDETDADGNLYTYTVREVGVPDGYTKAESGLTVTNTYEIPTDGSATATKSWVNGPTTDHTAVTINLYREAPSTPRELVNATPVVTGTAPTFTYKWTGLEKTNAAGEPYTFTVEEVGVVDGKITVDGREYAVTQDENNITNTYVIPTDGTATATKTWVNGPTSRPTVWFKLYRNIAGGDPVEVPGAEIKELLSGTTSVEWTGLETTDINGNAYTFSVKEGQMVEGVWTEGAPENYEASYSESGLTVTNTYVPPQTENDLVGTKVWENGPKPGVAFELWRKNGDAGTGVKVAGPTAVNPTTNTVNFGKHPKTDINGVAYEYYVIEPVVPANYSKVESGMTVTNTYTQPETDDLVGTKVWVNGPKPAVEFELWRKNGTAGTGEKVVDATAVDTDTLTVNFGKQLKTDINGVEYEYYVIEPEVPENYSKVESGLTVTNTYGIPEDGKLDFTKNWEGDPTVTRPTLVLTLWRKTDTGTDEAVPGAETKEVDGTITTASWTGLEETDIDGNAYTFYVKEAFKVDKPSNANWKLGEYNFEDNTITNTVVTGEDKAGSLQIEKVLVNELPPAPIGINAPLEFTVVVTDEYGNATSRTIKAGETITIEDLYYGKYTIEETVTHGYIPTYEPESVTVEKDQTEAPKFVVTNSRAGGDDDPNAIDVTVTKVWKDGPKPDTVIELWRKGVEVDGTTIIDEKVGDFTATATVLSHIFEGLAKHDPSGREFEYYVVEPTVPDNYTALVEGLTVTNTYVITKIDVTATKVWKGGSGTRPTIRLQLYRDGVAYGSPVDLVHPNTTYTWKDLDKTDLYGKAYTYTVDEVDVPANYSKSVVGLTITNTYVGGTKPPEVPYTGDASNALLYGVLALSSLAGFGAVTVAKRRKKK